MQSLLRSPLLRLLALGVVAVAGLSWLLFSGPPAGEAGHGVGMAMPELTGRRGPATTESAADFGDVDPATKEARELADPPGASVRTSIAPMASSAGAEVESVAVLIVQDLASGLPVAGAMLGGVFHMGEPLDAAEAWRASISGEDGRIEVVARTAPQPESTDGTLDEVRLDLRIVADGYVEAIAAAVPARREDAAPQHNKHQGGADGEVQVVPARVVSLQRSGALVLDVVGAPAGKTGELAVWFDSNARSRRPDLALEWPIDAKRGRPDDVDVSVESGMGGSTRVTLERLPPGSLSVALAIQGRPVALEQSLVLLPGERLRQTLELKAGEVASGVVVDLVSRQPAPGVSIQVTPAVAGLTRRLDELPYPPVITDTRGAFSVVGLPEGPIPLTLITPDGANHPREITVVEGNQTRSHLLSVRGSAELRGTVQWPEGVSGAGLQVLVTTADAASHVEEQHGEFRVQGNFGPGTLAKVDAGSGKFVAERVPSGRKLVVYAIARGTSLGIATVPALKLGERREGVEVVLVPRSERLFRVTSSTGEVVDRVRVSFLGPWTIGSAAGRAASGRKAPSRWTARETVVARSDGLFAASPALEGIDRIRIWWGDHARGAFEWPDGDPGDLPVFELDPDPVVVVEVLGSDGLAVRGARVLAVLEDEGGGQTKKKPQRGPSSSARTDEFGRARLGLPSPVESGGSRASRLRVSADGFITRSDLEIDLEDALPAAPLQVILERPERIEWGRITGRLVRPSGDAMPSPRFDGLRGGTAHFDDHDFEIRGLRPGRYQLVAHCDRFESVALQTITLGPGERLDVGEVIMRHATRLDVIVKDSKGRKVKDAQVQLVRPNQKEGGARSGLPRKLDFPRTSQPVGRFRRANVPRSRWRLVVNLRGHQPYSEIVTVSGAAKVFEVTLKANP